MSDDDVHMDSRGRDDEDRPSSGGLMSHPILIGLLAGILVFLAIAFALPHSENTAPGVTVSVAQDAPAEEAAPVAAETPAEPVPQETGPAPAADVPIVAEAAIVITDTGLNRRVATAIDSQMPRETTLAISVYATDPDGTASAFKSSGRDVWLHIAAQSVQGGIDPGPLSVAGSMSAKENADLIRRQLNIAGRSVIGIFVPHDADITLNQDKWRDVAESLIAENRMILDATAAKVATSVYMQGSAQQISAYLKADVVVSAANGPDALKAALEAAVPTILKQQEAIVVVGGLTVPSVDVLAAWTKTLASQGIRLVPASKFTGLTQ